MHMIRDSVLPVDHASHRARRLRRPASQIGALAFENTYEITTSDKNFEPDPRFLNEHVKARRTNDTSDQESHENTTENDSPIDKTIKTRQKTTPLIDKNVKTRQEITARIDKLSV